MKQFTSPKGIAFRFFQLSNLETYLNERRRSLVAFTPEGLDKKVDNAIRDFISNEFARMRSDLGHGVPGEPQNSLLEQEAYRESDKVAPFYLYVGCDNFEF